MTLLYCDDLFLKHIPGVPHPERPQRIDRARGRLEKAGIDRQCVFGKADPIEREKLLRLHSTRQVELAEATCKAGGGHLDNDTPVSPRSFDAALLAAGCGIAAVDEVLAGNARNAFCMVRPPGHHATPTRSMGFCLFDNIALAAAHAIDKHELTRILIVDWDVHHGNGTQDAFYDDPRVLFFSAHRYPFYPGTGAANETGAGKGAGYTINMPVAYGTEPAEYRQRFERTLQQAVDRIKPELVLISAGFDAHRLDPIGSLDLEVADFVALGKMVLDSADAHCSGRVVSMLEGGYDVDVLAECIEQHVRQLIAAG